MIEAWHARIPLETRLARAERGWNSDPGYAPVLIRRIALMPVGEFLSGYNGYYRSLEEEVEHYGSDNWGRHHIRKCARITPETTVARAAACMRESLRQLWRDPGPHSYCDQCGPKSYFENASGAICALTTPLTREAVKEQGRGLLADPFADMDLSPQNLGSTDADLDLGVLSQDDPGATGTGTGDGGPGRADMAGARIERMPLADRLRQVEGEDAEETGPAVLAVRMSLMEWFDAFGRMCGEEQIAPLLRVARCRMRLCRMDDDVRFGDALLGGGRGWRDFELDPDDDEVDEDGCDLAWRRSLELMERRSEGDRDEEAEEIADLFYGRDGIRVIDDDVCMERMEQDAMTRFDILAFIVPMAMLADRLGALAA